MATKVMVPLAEGFEEIEAMAVIDILRRAGLDVETVGVVGSVIQSAHGVRVMTDKRLPQVNSLEYEAIILPGGSPGYINLGRSSQLMEILRDFHERNKIIAAICGAPTLLAKQGILDDKRATIYPGLERQLSYPRPNRVVVDGNIITSQGPGTAMEFALAIVKKLVGDQAAEKLKRELVM